MVRANFAWAVTVIFLAMVEVTWLGVIRIGDVVPDLVLLMTVYFALTVGDERAMFTGLLGGVIQDVAADASLGHHVLCLVLVAYGASRVSERLVTDNPMIQSSVVLVASIVHGLLYISIDYLQGAEAGVFDAIMVSLIPKTFYTMLVTPVLFVILTRAVYARLQVSNGGAV